MNKEVSTTTLFLVGLAITFVGNFFPAGYSYTTAGTLLDVIGVIIMIVAVVRYFKKKKTQA